LVWELDAVAVERLRLPRAEKGNAGSIVGSLYSEEVLAEVT
jgi:hypothetical protein